MEIAVLSDIHGNFEAFQASMDYALARNIHTFLFLGDYLGEFAYPQRTMEYIYHIRDHYQCIFVRGNKEDYWLNYRRCGAQGWKQYDSTTGSLYYSYHSLTEKDFLFFEQMKAVETVQFGDIEPITICHGSPRRVNEKLLPEMETTYEIMEQSSTRLILCGHTHIQNKIEYREKAILNAGSVGLAFHSKGAGAQFMILSQDGSLWKEEFLTVHYDVEKEIARLHEAGLDKMAPYWCKMTKIALRTGEDSHSFLLDKAMERCKQKQGECVWPNIPECYWEEAYQELYGAIE